MYIQKSTSFYSLKASKLLKILDHCSVQGIVLSELGACIIQWQY